MTKDLSIIIVNYKTQEQLEVCLNSISDNIPGVDHEVIVINNDENELEIGKEAPSIVINSKKNVGFGAANNIGAKNAQGKYILFLNPDALLQKENVKDILDEFEKDESIGIIGPKIVTKGGSVQDWSAGSEVTLADLIKK